MNKLLFFENKTLKLKNVLMYEISEADEEVRMDVLIEQIKSYIRAKGTKNVGPLIQCIRNEIAIGGQLNVNTSLMMQCDKQIINTEYPYIFQEEVKVEDALYCRYQGPQNSFGLAYDKIKVEAFEKNILLGNEMYSIFLDNEMAEDEMITDVFIKKG